MRADQPGRPKPISQPRSLAAHPLVRALLADHGLDPRLVNLAVHPADEMFQHGMTVHGGNSDLAAVHYARTGLEIAAAVRQIVQWRFGGFQAAARILDFGSGYGRATRFVAPECRSGSLWVSEINEQALDFQREQFGVRGLASTVRPDDFVCPHEFDCIFVISLFTHLPEKSFGGWLARLLRSLAPGGVLIFTVRDLSGRPDGTSRAGPGGLVYEPDSENLRLDRSEYGTTWVTEDFVRETLARHAGGHKWVRIPRGLLHLQDIWVVLKGDADLATIRFDRGPEGLLETCYLADERHLQMAGWAVNRNEHSELLSVRATLGGRLLKECRKFYPREDVARHLEMAAVPAAGWDFVCELEAGVSSGFDSLIVKAVNTRGLEHAFFVGTIDSASAATYKVGYEKSERARLALDERVRALECLQPLAGQPPAHPDVRRT